MYNKLNKIIMATLLCIGYSVSTMYGMVPAQRKAAQYTGNQALKTGNTLYRRWFSSEQPNTKTLQEAINQNTRYAPNRPPINRTLPNQSNAPSNSTYSQLPTPIRQDTTPRAWWPTANSYQLFLNQTKLAGTNMYNQIKSAGVNAYNTTKETTGKLYNQYKDTALQWGKNIGKTGAISAASAGFLNYRLNEQEKKYRQSLALVRQILEENERYKKTLK